LLTNLPASVKAAPAVALLEGTGLVDDYLAYPVSTRNPIVLGRLWWELRRRRYGMVVNLAAWRGPLTLRRDRVFFSMAGKGVLVGFEGGEGGESRPPEGGIAEREAERLLRRVKRIGSADVTDSRLWDLKLTDGERAGVRRRLAGAGLGGGFVALTVGTKVPANDWTQPNWLAFTKRLGAAYPRLGCAFVGSADEAARARDCLERWPGPSVNLCGKLTPRESAAVLSFARFFVGHDSGPMHLAACVRTPCVAIFGARNPPGQWFPFGRGHRILYHKTACFGCGLTECVKFGKQCILSITVDEVMEAACAQLDDAAASAWRACAVDT
jgi:hypothetical protein